MFSISYNGDFFFYTKEPRTATCSGFMLFFGLTGEIARGVFHRNLLPDMLFTDES